MNIPTTLFSKLGPSRRTRYNTTAVLLLYRQQQRNSDGSNSDTTVLRNVPHDVAHTSWQLTHLYLFSLVLERVVCFVSGRIRDARVTSSS